MSTRKSANTLKSCQHLLECSYMHKWCQQYDDASNFFLSTFQVKYPVGEKDSVDQITRPKQD